jgi:hypothetical protein
MKDIIFPKTSRSYYSTKWSHNLKLDSVVPKRVNKLIQIQILNLILEFVEFYPNLSTIK